MNDETNDTSAGTQPVLNHGIQSSSGNGEHVPPDEESQPSEDEQLEIEAYYTLISLGGRPSHPISLLKDVVRNPGQYREILAFWQVTQMNGRYFKNS